MTSDTLSIVIPSHRRVDLLKLCLESVFRFAPSNTQVIVVDDGSVNACVTNTASCFKGVEILRVEKPLGFCRAANAGIAVACGKVVELLNDDAEVTLNWAVEPLRNFRDAPSTAAVVPLIVQSPSQRIDSAGDDYDPGGFARKLHHDEPLHHFETCEVTSVSACAAFYRRSALLEVGGFPEEFGAYFDDVDLSCRLRERGYSLLFEPASMVWHRVSSTYGRQSRKLIEQQSRNEEWLYWRNSASWSTLPRHLAVLAGKALRRIEEGTLGPWLTGRIRAFRPSPPSRSAMSGSAPSPVQSS